MKRVLLVCTDPPRLQQLRAHYERDDAHVAWYPHDQAYLLDLADERPALLVVDLTLPVAPKLNVVRRARALYPDLPVLLIGKGEYLRQEGLFQHEPGVAWTPDLDRLPAEAP
ncbi:MAG TPA: hypothetical protein PK961_00105 [bacterium]|nr:hypothetical protein [bacterium]